MKNIAVFYGGASVEHDVSVISGVLTVNALDKERYNAVPIYVDYNGLWYTGKGLNDISVYKNLDVNKLEQVTLSCGKNILYKVKRNKLKELCVLACAVNCMHGERGEDGSLVGLLNMCGVPLASPGLVPSSVCMDKSISKIFFKGMGVKHLPCVTLSELDGVERAGELGFPLIVKPCTGGSSIGVRRADNFEQLKKAVDFAFRYSHKVVVEKLLTDFTEINCAVYKNHLGSTIVSEVERPIGEKQVLTFLDKYSFGSREFPAKIEKRVENKIKEITKKCYEELGMEGIVRFDFMIKDGVVYLNEINTVPGSLAYYLFCDTFKEFSKILNGLIVRAEQGYAKTQTLIKKYSSSVLELKGVKSSKRL